MSPLPPINGVAILRSLRAENLRRRRVAQQKGTSLKNTDTAPTLLLSTEEQVQIIRALRATHSTRKKGGK